MAAEDAANITPEEAVALGSTDPRFFGHYFFPKTVRQSTPPFHELMHSVIDDPTNRYISFLVFRDGAKTTTTRLLAARYIAYGLTNTIVWLGKSQDHAMKSVEWLLRAVKFNARYAGTFGLHLGAKESVEEVEIINDTLGLAVRILALGMTGSVRGINVDDYRPDLIIGDDIIDEEMAASKTQRQKTEDLWYGAVGNSLAPRSEAPFAKQILLGTPIDSSDINMKCFEDEMYKSVRIGIFDERGESRWPQRWSTDELQQEKKSYIRRNQLSIWTREKECRVISSETALLRNEWLRYYDILPERMQTFIAIDPVPPPSELEIARDLRDKDFEALAVVGAHGPDVFLLEYVANRGHEPDWTVMQFWRLIEKWNVQLGSVESVAYQRTLKWLLEQSMKQRRRYVQLNDKTDKRSKSDRIADYLVGISSQGHFYCHRSHTDFIEQYGAFPKVDHDDVLEAVAVATGLAQNRFIIDTEYNDQSEMYEPLPLEDFQRAP